MVTGASGELGRAISKGLASFGASLALVARGRERLEEVGREVSRYCDSTMTAVADVTDPVQVDAAVERALSEFGRIDVLVTSHGTNIRKPALEISLEEWQRVMDVNLKGTFNCCRSVGKVMIKQNSGRIVNISSIAGGYTNPRGYTAYSPSKAAVNMLTKALACEWAPYNITVNAIAPTFIPTTLTKNVLRGDFYEEVISRIPLGRLGTPNDIVGAVIFLSSDASSFITGQVLYVDGGTTAAYFGSWARKESAPS